MDEPMKDKEPIIEDYPVLKFYEDVFGEFPIFPPKTNIDIFIDLMPRAVLVSKNPY
jgi:hypothetical protein